MILECVIFIPLLGDAELFDWVLTRGDEDEAPAVNCAGGVPINYKKRIKYISRENNSCPI